MQVREGEHDGQGADTADVRETEKGASHEYGSLVLGNPPVDQVDREEREVRGGYQPDTDAVPLTQGVRMATKKCASP